MQMFISVITVSVAGIGRWYLSPVSVKDIYNCHSIYTSPSPLVSVTMYLSPVGNTVFYMVYRSYSYLQGCQSGVIVFYYTDVLGRPLLWSGVILGASY